MTSPVVDIEPRTRIVGALLGHSPSRRRGRSSDVVGSRPYRPGDDVRLLDWGTSARASAAAGEQRFVVREFYAEEAPVVVLAVDCSATMGLYPPPLPWLHKPSALRRCLDAVAESAALRRCPLAYVDSAGRGWEPPRQLDSRRTPAWAGLPAVNAAGAPGWPAQALVERQRWLPPGTVVFVFSDFLTPIGDRLLAEAAHAEWDLVPIVLSDPRWERSFPEEVAGLTLPLPGPDGLLRPLRLSRQEASELRLANESRHTALLRRCHDAGFPAVVVDAADDRSVAAAFFAWARLREALA